MVSEMEKIKKAKDVMENIAMALTLSNVNDVSRRYDLYNSQSQFYQHHT